MKKAVLTTLILFITLLCIGQISYENRIEFPLSHKYERKDFFDFGKDGLVVHSRENETPNNKTIWEYKLYDTNLKPIKELKVLIHNKSSYRRTRHTNENIHTLYESNEKNTYTLITTAIPSLDTIKVETKLPPKRWARSMHVIGEHIFFELIDISESDIILVVNWKTGKQKLIPKILNDSDARVVIKSLLPNPKKNSFTVHAVGRNKRENDYIVFFDDTGSKINEVNLNEINGAEYDILDASGIKNDDQRHILTGTYYKKKRKYGIFFSVLNENKVEFSSTNNYEDLEDFFGLADLEKKEKRKQKSLLESKGLHYMKMHEVIPMHDGYLLVGQVSHRIDSNEDYLLWAMLLSPNQFLIDSRYTHAALLKFDYEGNLKWNKSFRTWVSYESISERKYMNIVEKDENSVKLVYTTDNILKSIKIGHDGKIIEEYEFESAKTDLKAKQKWLIEDVNYWYDDYLIVYEERRNRKGNGRKNTISFSKVKYK